MDPNIRSVLRLILLLSVFIAASLAQQQQQQQEELPVLPPVFIPPNTPQGPPPALQSPIRNLFQGGESENSISSFFSRLFRIFTG